MVQLPYKYGNLGLFKPPKGKKNSINLEIYFRTIKKNQSFSAMGNDNFHQSCLFFQNYSNKLHRFQEILANFSSSLGRLWRRPKRLWENREHCEVHNQSRNAIQCKNNDEKKSTRRNRNVWEFQASFRIWLHNNMKYALISTCIYFKLNHKHEKNSYKIK